jgi:multidrug transporter EmrE-like cation transporter
MILVNVGLMGGSVVFPVHNASVVMLTALIGMFFFKEKFTARQWSGVILAIISVIIIAGTI